MGALTTLLMRSSFQNICQILGATRLLWRWDLLASCQENFPSHTTKYLGPSSQHCIEPKSLRSKGWRRVAKQSPRLNQQGILVIYSAVVTLFANLLLLAPLSLSLLYSVLSGNLIDYLWSMVSAMARHHACWALNLTIFVYHAPSWAHCSPPRSIFLQICATIRLNIFSALWTYSDKGVLVQGRSRWDGGCKNKDIVSRSSFIDVHQCAYD